MEAQKISAGLGRRAALALVGAVGATWASKGWAGGGGSADEMPRNGISSILPAQSETPRALTPPLRVTRRCTVSACDLAEWGLFKHQFITADGRVVDTANGGVSHTEGQGWGMMFAVAFDDMATFDLLHGWTRQHLSRAYDSLYAWRYFPRSTNPVPDQNNATDGDLFIASALWRGAHQWGRPELADAARPIARDILKLLVRNVAGRTVLLPGAAGFEQKGAVTINPSYYVFPLLEEMESLVPSPVWSKLRSDGLAVISEGRFGSWNLSPDWLRLDAHTGTLSPHPNWPARFSYDAVRVPLWLAWSEQPSTDVGQSCARYWTSRQFAPPAWIDLKTNMSASYPALPGMNAIAHVATLLSQRNLKTSLPLDFPAVAASPNYYSSALTLLSRLAWIERHLV